VGAETESVKKQKMSPTKKRWEKMLDYIANTPTVHDVVVSGGDSYYLDPEHLAFIGSRLLAIPHVKRFRFASKGINLSSFFPFPLSSTLLVMLAFRLVSLLTIYRSRRLPV
jgi:lysine 2,3-aminomutase